MSDELFEQMKERLISLDPVAWVQRYLTLDGEPFRIEGNGYKPFADIYRYIGFKLAERPKDESEENQSIKPVILVKGRQVGATTMASALTLYYTASGLYGFGGKAPIQLIHAFPTLIHVYRYSKTKLSAQISTSIRILDKNINKTKPYIETRFDKSNPANNSLQFKQFLGANVLQIESTGLDADRLRGGTVDGIFYDECQDIPNEAIANANRLLTKAKHGIRGVGIQVYFGTPKSKNSKYYEMWSRSTQQYYYLGCENCNEHFPLYTPNSTDWYEKIWIYGYIVKCTHCGHEQDKRAAAERGKWIATRPIEECDYIGYHINQLYMPEFTREKILNQRPDKSVENTERTWQNEILGEFYAGEMGLITPDIIREKCGDPGRKMEERILLSDNKKVYAGFDWGKKNSEESIMNSGGKSHSCSVVLVDEGTFLSVVYTTIFSRNDLEYKKGLVETILRQYSVNRAVGDIGYANDLTEILQSSFGEKFLASNSLAKVNDKVKFNNEIFPKTILFEKDYYVSEVIDLMKRGMIKFPYGDFEKISWLVEHCTSMEIKTTLNQYNEPVIRFVKGQRPNDGFMALINAYLAYKFDLTRGFQDNKINITRQNNNNKPLAVTAYMPKKR